MIMTEIRIYFGTKMCDIVSFLNQLRKREHYIPLTLAIMMGSLLFQVMEAVKDYIFLNNYPLGLIVADCIVYAISMCGIVFITFLSHDALSSEPWMLPDGSMKQTIESGPI